MAMIIPLPHYENLLEIFLTSEEKKRCFSGLVQNVWARVAVARHFAPPPPSKHPGAAPESNVQSDVKALLNNVST